MMRLAIRTLRFRKGGFIATFVAVVFGTAIVMACGGLMETGIRSNVAPERFAAAPIVVSGPQSHKPAGADEDLDAFPLTEVAGVPADLLTKIRAVEGVTGVIGDRSFPAPIVTPSGPVVAEGHNWASVALAPYQLMSGRAPGVGEVVSAGAKVGSKVSVLVHGVPQSFTVSGTATGPAGHTFFSERDATRLAPKADRYAAIGVLVAPGTDLDAVGERIEALGDLTVRTGIDRGLAEHPGTGIQRTALISIAGSFGGIAVMTMMFVVASTLALSAQHREREFALLRGIGTTPGQVRRMILGEGMLVALPAVAFGILPGMLLGRFLFDQLAEHGVASPLITFYQGLIPFAAGAGGAVLAVIGAALIAARKSAKIKPVQALMESSLQRKWFSWVRLIAGLLFLGGGMALLIVTATVMVGPLAGATAGPSVLCWAIGVALLGPFWTKLALALWRWPVQLLSRVNGRLAIRNVSVRSVAMSAAVMPVMLAVGISTANLYMQTTQVDASAKAFTRDLNADIVLTSTVGMAPQLVEQVRSVPGVAGASAYVRSTGVIDEPQGAPLDDDGAPLIGIDAQGPNGTAPVRLTAGSLSGLTGSTVALPEYIAQKINRGVGSTITMTLGDGTSETLRVVAIFAAERGYESIVLPSALVTAHTTDGLIRQILVRTTPGAQVTPALTKLAATHPGVQVADREALVSANAEDQKTQAWVNYMLVGMLIAYTAVSVVNTLVSTTLRRRREFALQRLTGSTRNQVLRMLTAESTLITLSGITLGTLVALASLLPYASKVANSLPTGPLWIYLLIITAATTLTFTSTLLPAALTLRHSPTQPTHAD
ncbi:ABC transporter permease [Kribbella sp. NBC_01505]|uniref:FtsX-like permease family protein n=1 Tax=Kribbella sp. NBC_01505 TaxID=2903580 RepID=UPI00386A2C9C